MQAAVFPDFIEVYDDALDPAVCRALAQRFDGTADARRGATGSGVNLRLKNSWDIRISDNAAWTDAEALLNRAALGGLRRYVRTYPHTVLAPLQLQVVDPATAVPRQLAADDITAMDDAALDGLLAAVFRPGPVNLQKYLANEGGYPYWHCELYPMTDGGETLHRVLLWTIYLTDAFRGGETEFHHQRRRITPKVGSLLIAPAAFTHTHRGNMPRDGDKLIATSWILFQRAEVLYA